MKNIRESLDLACHNGRWSYAALRLGAKHVTGVDFNSKYIDAARSILRKDFPVDSFEFHAADMMEFLHKQEQKQDVILCLGILYHTMKQLEILEQCNRLTSKLLIVDSTVLDTEAAPEDLYSLIRMPKRLKHIEATSQENVLFTVTGKAADGRWETIPSRRMLEIWIEEAGFRHEKMELADPKDYQQGGPDFLKGLRVAYHCRPTTG